MGKEARGSTGSSRIILSEMKLLSFIAWKRKRLGGPSPASANCQFQIPQCSIRGRTTRYPHLIPPGQSRWHFSFERSWGRARVRLFGLAWAKIFRRVAAQRVFFFFCFFFGGQSFLAPAGVPMTDLSRSKVQVTKAQAVFRPLHRVIKTFSSVGACFLFYFFLGLHRFPPNLDVFKFNSPVCLHLPLLLLTLCNYTTAAASSSHQPSHLCSTQLSILIINRHRHRQSIIRPICKLPVPAILGLGLLRLNLPATLL